MHLSSRNEILYSPNGLFRPKNTHKLNGFYLAPDGIQEVSGSIPLISTKNLRNLRISEVFLYLESLSGKQTTALRSLFSPPKRPEIEGFQVFEHVKKGCHCEEGAARRGNLFSKMLPFWLWYVQNRKFQEFLAHSRKNLWICPRMTPFSSRILWAHRSFSIQLSTEKPGNSHSMIRANHTSAPTS